jgi:UDP-glucose 4-epimerase
MLLTDPTKLRILGDGSQSKSYIHVEDVVAAMLTLTDQGWAGFDVFNAGTGEHVTVTEIAALVGERMGIDDVRHEYTGGSRGWKGDVPVVRFRSDKLRARGWRCRYSSIEALTESIDANISEAGLERVSGQTRAFVHPDESTRSVVTSSAARSLRNCSSRMATQIGLSCRS